MIRCVYDAKAVGFHRHIDNSRDDESTVEVAGTDEAPPETDQLSDADIIRITNETRRGLHLLRRSFMRPGYRVPFLEMFDTDEEEDTYNSDVDFELDDLDEEDDMELDLELDEDDGFMDEDGVQVFEHNGEFYVTMYETASEDEDEEEEEMHDAVENQQAHNDDVD